MQTPRPFRDRVVLVVAFLLTVALSGLSEAGLPPAFVKEKLVQTEKIWSGQRLTLYISLYSTTSFSGSTRFNLPRVSGMMIMESKAHPLIGTENIDGLSYIFKRHEIDLFPLRSDILILPAFSVEFSFRGETGRIVNHSFTTKPHQFKVLEIPGASSQRNVITTANLEVEDRWITEPEKVKVGDALTRTITMLADDLPGMAFPPLNLKKVDGLGCYLKQPQVEDKVQRGEFVGKRTETITYICERKGTFIIPGTTLQWWNPKTETLQTVFLKKVKFEVVANLALGKRVPEESYRAEGAGSLWVSSVAIFIIFAICALVAMVYFRFRSKRQLYGSDRSCNEVELFKEFKKSALSNDALASMQSLLCWLDYSELAGRPGSLVRFSALAGNPELDKQIASLETFLYASGPGREWFGYRLFTVVRQARKTLSQNHPEVEQFGLPTLNP